MYTVNATCRVNYQFKFDVVRHCGGGVVGNVSAEPQSGVGQGKTRCHRKFGNMLTIVKG